MSRSVQFADTATSSTTKHSVYTRPAKKPKMSLTQTYFLAHSARGKLSKEAARADHDLRLLVGHANMLDSLMIDLANAEQEQERWFNQSLHGATVDPEEEEDAVVISTHDTITEEPEVDWEAEDAEIDSEDDEDATSDHLTLTRTKSRSHSPPELTADSESDSEDEHMPSSPPDEKIHMVIKSNDVPLFSAKEVTMSAAEAESFEEDGFFIPSRSQPILIAAN